MVTKNKAEFLLCPKRFIISFADIPGIAAPLPAESALLFFRQRWEEHTALFLKAEDEGIKLFAAPAEIGGKAGPAEKSYGAPIDELFIAPDVIGIQVLSA